jgi:hypothetical protein
MEELDGTAHPSGFGLVLAHEMGHVLGMPLLHEKIVF